MAVAEQRSLKRAGSLVGEQRTLSGWGRTCPSRATVFRPRHSEDIAEVLALGARAGTGVIARGAGRSYGDAAQNAGGAVLDTSGLERIGTVDRARRLVSAQAGATVAGLIA